MSKKPTVKLVAETAARAAAAALRQSDDLVIETGEEPDEEELAKLNALHSLQALAADHDDYQVVINCLSPLDKKGRLEVVSLEEIPTLDQLIADRYGPGKYQIILQGPSGYVKGSSRILTVSPLARRTPAASSSPAAAAPGSDLRELIIEQRRQDEQRRQERREDNKFMLQLFVGALPVLSGMFRPPSLADQAAAMQALGMGGAKGNGGDVLEAVFKGIDLRDKLAGSDKPESLAGVVRDVVRDLLQAPATQNVLDSIANRTARGAQPQRPMVPYQPPARPAAVVAPPAAAPAAAPPSGAPAAPELPASAEGQPGAPATSEAEMQNFLMQQAMPVLQALATDLLAYAQNAAHPAVAADALVAKVPRMMRAYLKPEQLQQWLTAPNWWQVLCQFKPDLQPYQGFCDEVRLELLRLLTEVESGEQAE